MRTIIPTQIARSVWIGSMAVAFVGCSSNDATSASTTGAASSAAAASDDDGAPLKAGDAAPDVTMTLHDGSKVSLAEKKGTAIVVYFYPKDDTPGCRVEAQGIRDSWEDFKTAGVEVYGVSLQDADSHKAFIEKESLPFPLVVDTDGAVAKAFHVPVKGEYASRQTFLIGKDGKIAKVWLDVSPDGHAKELLAAAK